MNEKQDENGTEMQREEDEGREDTASGVGFDNGDVAVEKRRGDTKTREGSSNGGTRGGDIAKKGIFECIGNENQ